VNGVFLYLFEFAGRGMPTTAKAIQSREDYLELDVTSLTPERTTEIILPQLEKETGALVPYAPCNPIYQASYNHTLRS
jgi:hypothetical protein